MNKRILVITVPAWNKRIGANTWESLLESYDSSLVANISIRDEVPDSTVCSRYFHISEMKVLRSVFCRSLNTGYEREINDNRDINKSFDETLRSQIYDKTRKKRSVIALLVRELLWKLGKWKSSELDRFLDNFNPDVILYATQSYIHFNRIVEYCIKHTDAKAVGYFWDDNFSKKRREGFLLKHFYYNRIRQSIRDLVNCSDQFFSINAKMKQEADAFFNIDSVLLTKPLNSLPNYMPYKLHCPIRMLYTGNLYIGRNDSLMRIAKMTGELSNKGVSPFIIDVYTNSIIEEMEKKQLASYNCFIHQAIPQSEVLEMQRHADVLLFLEAIDDKQAVNARLSFSTKITDYLSSGKCIFAVGNKDIAPIDYLRETDAAFVATNDFEIRKVLIDIVKNSKCVNECAKRGAEIGYSNHNKGLILSTFYNTLNQLFE